MPKYFPCFTDVEAHHILVFGGDAHALAKVKKLLAYAPCITVVSPAPCKELIALQKEGKINTVCRDLTECEEILDEFSPKLVFVTQADPPYDAAVFSACRARKIEINTEDKPRYCTFIFPSLIQRGALTVAIGTGGASPAVAKKLREELETSLPDAIEDILDWLASLRPSLQSDTSVPRERRAALWRALADRAFLLNRPLQEAETLAVIEHYRA